MKHLDIIIEQTIHDSKLLNEQTTPKESIGYLNKMDVNHLAINIKKYGDTVSLLRTGEVKKIFETLIKGSFSKALICAFLLSKHFADLAKQSKDEFDEIDIRKIIKNAPVYLGRDTTFNEVLKFRNSRDFYNIFSSKI